MIIIIISTYYSDLFIFWLDVNEQEMSKTRLLSICVGDIQL